MSNLVVATSNPGKLQEMQAYLRDLAWQLTLKPAELEIEETGTTFAENARLKASQVARAVQQWAIADDSGLEVAALGGAPGLYSSRYGNSDRDRIERLLRELGDTEARSACFVCVVAVARPDGEIVLEAEGICPGEILRTPQGTGGFGYDPVFYATSAEMTFAQMPPETKQALSHRGIAFAKLRPQLQDLARQLD